MLANSKILVGAKMKKELDIYNYERIIVRELQGIENADICKKNKKLILEFKDYLVRDNISVPRIIKYMGTLKLIALKVGKDFDKLTKKDAEKFVSLIQGNTAFSPWTKQCYKVIFKRFFKWVKKSGDVYPEEVRWIKIKINENEKILPAKGDLLSEEDVKKIIDCAQIPRDKAIVSVLYETGCRIGEIASLQIKNLEFDEMGILLSVTGKTGPRKIRVIASTQYLMNWINMHALKDDRDAPLWITLSTNNRMKFMKYAIIRKMIAGLFAKAGIKKRCNPHLFRHSRATFLAKHLTEFQMNQYFGWKQGSDMPSTYVHLSGRDLDNAIFSVNGVGMKREAEKPKLQPAICPRCSEINAPGSKYCSKCAAMLDVQTILEHENQQRAQQRLQDKTSQVMELLLADEDIRKLITEKFKGVKLENSN